MVVVGFNLKKILVERKKALKGAVKVSTKMNISKVNKEPFKLTEGKDVLSFDFEFSIIYKGSAEHAAEIANISYEGNVLFLTDPKDTKKVLDSWKKKEIPSDIKLKVLNTILAKCSIKALIFEEDMGLPSHLKLPRFQSREKK